MKFDKFLAALFSRKAIIVILLVVLAAFCLTACQLTCEDVFCLTFFGCVSFDTCRDMIWSCGDCSSCGGGGSSGDGGGCAGNCIGDAYNEAFGCFWDCTLKDCRPSDACSKCEGDDTDESAPRTCDECTIDCLDSCVQRIETED